MIEKVMAWLRGFSLDSLGPGGGWGAFPQGLKELSRREDILGGVETRCRLTVRLVYNGVDGQAALEGFDLSGAPVLGENQTVKLEEARLAAKAKDGLPRYEAKLIFEFTQ